MSFDIRRIQERVIYGAVAAASDAECAERVVCGEKGAPPEEDAAWVKSVMRRLEERFDPAAVKRIRRGCQCGYGMDEKLAFVKDLVACSSSLEELASHDRAKAAGLSWADGRLHLQFQSCPCPMLARVDRLPTAAWCQCTTGYSKVLFEKAFGCEVEVELLKSIKMGHEICLMTIVPLGRIWK